MFFPAGNLENEKYFWGGELKTLKVEGSVISQAG